MRDAEGTGLTSLLASVHGAEVLVPLPRALNVAQAIDHAYRGCPGLIIVKVIRQLMEPHFSALTWSYRLLASY